MKRQSVILLLLCAVSLVLMSLSGFLINGGHAQSRRDLSHLSSEFSHRQKKEDSSISPCGTVHPDVAQSTKLQSLLNQFKASRKYSKQDVIGGEKGSIMVYFHVIQESGVAGVSGLGYVPEATLDSQISMLNAGFQGADNSPLSGANTPFRFIKAGVDYHVNGSWFVSPVYGLRDTEMKSALRRGTVNDLNIYTKLPQTSDGMLVAGYSTFPWEYQANPDIDGVVISYDTLPGTDNPHRFGDTATHEVGHWLGLYHTFYPSDVQGYAVCDANGDFIDDTPTESYANYPQDGCPIDVRDTCPESPGYDPVDNFMDYSSDSCRYKFTEGQSKRMKDYYFLYRNPEISSTLRSTPFIQTIAAGETASFFINTKNQWAIDLYHSTLPPNTTATFSPKRIYAAQPSLLTITTSTSTPTGTYTLDITGVTFSPRSTPRIYTTQIYLDIKPVPFNGWRMDRVNPARTNVSTATGPQTQPQFNILVPNINEQLLRISETGDLILRGSDTVSSYSSGGQFKWRDSLGGIVDIAVGSDGTVYASTATTVFALNKDSGSLVWSNPYVANNGTESSPMAIGPDGIIYFLSGAGFVGYDPPNITAINPDGTMKFKTTADFGSGRGNQGFVMNNDATRIYLQGQWGLLMFSAATGNLSNSVSCDTRGTLEFTPFNTLYSADGSGNLLELDQSLSACTQTSTNIYGNVIALTPSGKIIHYVAPGDGRGNPIAAVDRQGNRLWVTSETYNQAFIDGNGTIYAATLFPSPDGLLYNDLAAISSQTGQVLWKKHFDQQIFSLFLGGNGRLYITTGDINSNSQIRNLYQSTTTSPGIQNPFTFNQEIDNRF